MQRYLILAVFTSDRNQTWWGTTAFSYEKYDSVFIRKSTTAFSYGKVRQRFHTEKYDSVFIRKKLNIFPLFWHLAIWKMIRQSPWSIKWNFYGEVSFCFTTMIRRVREEKVESLENALYPSNLRGEKNGSKTTKFETSSSNRQITRTIQTTGWKTLF